MARQQIRCHGDERRFEEVARFIYEHYYSQVRYIADVAGGQGLLTRILNKKYNFQAEVIDPRGFRLKGVPGQECLYTADMANFYDLIVGLHPDEAIAPIINSAKTRPILAIPCCNHWDPTKKLGTKPLIQSISKHLTNQNINHKQINFNFKGPKNIGLATGI